MDQLQSKIYPALIAISTLCGENVMIAQKRKSHGWTAVIWIIGTLLPPLGTFLTFAGHPELTFKYVQCTPLVAVAARFGIGRDFWINLPLTIAGYIPGSSFRRCYRLATHADPSYEGHVHNFYVQVCNPLHFGWITTLPRHCD